MTYGIIPGRPLLWSAIACLLVALVAWFAPFSADAVGERIGCAPALGWMLPGRPPALNDADRAADEACDRAARPYGLVGFLALGAAMGLFLYGGRIRNTRSGSGVTNLDKP